MLLERYACPLQYIKFIVEWNLRSNNKNRTVKRFKMLAPGPCFARLLCRKLGNKAITCTMYNDKEASERINTRWLE